MKITPESPLLSAYALDELDAAQALEVERAVAADPALRIALREFEKTVGFLDDVLGGGRPARLRGSQRRAVLRALDHQEPTSVVPAPRPRRLRVGVTLAAAAAVLMVAAVLAGRMGRPGGRAGGAVEVALLPMPGGGQGAAQVASGGRATEDAGSGRTRAELSRGRGEYFPAVARKLERSPLPGTGVLPATADQAGFTGVASLRLPVVLGTGSAVWVRRWIREKHSLPPRDAVRVEELVNSISLPTPAGGEGLQLGLEEMACPWNPKGRLIAVGLRAKDRDAQDLEIRWLSTAQRRVIGSFGRSIDQDLPTLLPAGRSNLVLLELADGSEPAGELVVSQGGRESRHDLEAAARGGTAMRQAIAWAVFGRWLRGEAGVDREMVRAALSGSGEDPVWRDTCELMEQALELAK